MIIEYDKLLESCDVLERVEHFFKDSFDAKGFLTDVFMVISGIMLVQFFNDLFILVCGT